MPYSAQIETHTHLMDQMADRLGADLDGAELRGDLPPGTRDAMVLSCTNCTSPEACQHWLQTLDSAAEAPEYCRNGEILVELANH